MSNPFLDDEPKSTNPFLSERGNPFLEDEDYSVGRQSIVSFVEGATGLGTEADALYRMIDEDISFTEALESTQRKQKQFKEENETLASVTSWGGVAAGFLVPGGFLAKSGQAVSKTRQVATAAAEGAVMGGLYQYAAEDLETGERGYGMGAVLGGTMGGLAGKYLLKNADELQKIEDELRSHAGRGTNIWGTDGIAYGADDTAVKVNEAGLIRSIEDSAKERTRGLASSTADSALVKHAGETEQTIDYVRLGTREFVEKYAGKRAGRLVSLAEQQIRMVDKEIVDLSGETLEKAMRVLERNPEAYDDFINMGLKRVDPIAAGPRPPKTIAEVVAEVGGEDGKALQDMVDVFTEARKLDMPSWKEVKIQDYFPRQAKGAMDKNKIANVNDYENPALAVRSYIEDVMQTRILANTFFKGEADDILAKLKPASDGQSRLDAMINFIEKRAKEEATTLDKHGKKVLTRNAEVAAHNLAVGLRSSLIASKMGGNAVGTNVRKFASTGLLANWSNAMLNVAEGVTLPIYMNGVRAFAEAAIPAVGATVNSIARQIPGLRKNVIDLNWIDNEAVGLGRNIMGEVQSAASGKFSKLLEQASNVSYKTMGVYTVNEMGQEILGNSAVKRAVREARKALKTGDTSAYAAMPAMRGANPDEINQSIRALASGKANNQWARDIYTQAVGLGQPAYSSSMPMGFNNHTNGRAFYSMLSYMNRQHNRIRTDIYLNAKDVAKYGINSERGKKAAKDALVNATMYTMTMGLANGIWNDFRKSVTDANERDYLGDGDIRGHDIASIAGALDWAVETTADQLSSNLSSGLFNMRAEEYGGQQINPLNTPALTMPIKGANAIVQGAAGDLEPAKRWAQTYMPGPAQADRMTRTLTGQRLFEAVEDGLLTPDDMR